MIEQREEEAEQASVIHSTLDKLHKRLTGEIPRKMLAKLDLPIKGLEFEGDKILVDGVSLDTMSTSEQMKFALVIARSLAQELKVICVDRYESLDKESRKAFEKEAGKDDFQYCIADVTDGDLSLQVVESFDKSTPKTEAKPEAVKSDF